MKVQIKKTKNGVILIVKGDHGGSYLLTPAKNRPNYFHKRHLNKKLAKKMGA